ncbi:trigger N domain-containing protein [Citrus sinensis]|uniref:uncharacterized protein LOC102622273 n=1 Tax=Citrus sinensis TaxID=2711 RepID=UPI00219F8701|nr:uncharacterized protein LOC102622273 [Citrus sinensis]KAH9727298.1 trigger N domain-containing protein [Citrus sinensis]
MEIAVKSLSLGLNPRIVNRRQHFDVSTPIISSKRACFLPQTRCDTHNFLKRKNHKNCLPIFVVLSAVEDAGVSSSQFEDFVVSTTRTNEATELKIGVEVSSAKTRAIFDDVFNKMVAAAQPIPGFRRVKGGKTPNIPRDILLEVLGPTNVYKEVIKKVIDTTVAEFVEKEDLKVSKDLRVEQSFEDLEKLFEPDEKFSFDAVIKLQETD